jgi:hypothetical protein
MARYESFRAGHRPKRCGTGRPGVFILLPLLGHSGAGLTRPLIVPVLEVFRLMR